MLSSNIYIPKTKSIYRVGNKEFSSDVTALAYLSANPGQHIEYDLDFRFLRNHDWRTEPTQDIKYYLREHARILANKYNDIGIMYSGGTDSHTVLSTFIDLNIPGIKLVNTTERTEQNSKWIHLKKPNQTLESNYSGIFSDLGYTEYGLSENLITRSITTSDWEKNVSTLAGSWNSDISGVMSPYTILNNYNPGIVKFRNRGCLIWGFEKPLLTIAAGWWCWQTHSNHWIQPEPIPVTDAFDPVFFFITDDVPEIQIKLSWMKIRILEEILKSTPGEITREHLDFIQSDRSTHYQHINRSLGYRAINNFLDSNLTKSSGYLFKLYLRDQKLSAAQTEIKNIINQYYDEYIMHEINTEFRNDTTKQLSRIFSKPIPITRISNELADRIDSQSFSNKK